MDGNNSREPAEVRFVQRENVRNAVRKHGSGKPRIVNLNTGDAVFDDKPSLFSIDRGTIRQ
jgi:hypothetical protein